MQYSALAGKSLQESKLRRRENMVKQYTSVCSPQNRAVWFEEDCQQTDLDSRNARSEGNRVDDAHRDRFGKRDDNLCRGRHVRLCHESRGVLGVDLGSPPLVNSLSGESPLPYPSVRGTGVRYHHTTERNDGPENQHTAEPQPPFQLRMTRGRPVIRRGGRRDV